MKFLNINKMNVGWSFCIVTSGSTSNNLLQIIKSIEDEFEDSGEKFEINIIGISNLINQENRHNINFYHFNEKVFKFRFRNLKTFFKTLKIEDIFFKTGAISQKKNFLAQKSKYDKLCIMHDYVFICKGWLKGFQLFGNDWEVAMNKILNNDGSRFRDWCNWDSPLVPVNDNYRASLLPYHLYIKEMYISGTFFNVKKDFLKNNPLNENLFWGEGEDVEWSKRVRKKTKFKMNTHSSVKLLKLKPLDQPPYCDSWKENERILLRELEKLDK